MRSFIAASLFAGVALALPAPQETETVYDTKVYTVTSCGPEVTNCPARHTTSTAISVTTHPAGPVGYRPSGGYSHGGDSWGSSSSVASTVKSSSTPAPPAPYSSLKTTPAPTPSPYSSSAAWSSTSSVESISESCSSSTSSAPAPPQYSAPAVSASANVSSSPIAHVSTTQIISYPTAPASYSSAPPAAPYPIASSYHVAPASYYPTSTSAPSASGYASGSGAGPKATGSQVPYTGGASSLHIAGSLIGVGAFAALWL